MSPRASSDDAHDASPQPRAAIALAVRSTLDREAKVNEVRVAIVRTFGWAAMVPVDLATGLLGLRPLANIVWTLTFAIVASALLALLKRAPFQAWYRWVLPLVDAMMLAAILDNRLRHHGTGVGLVATSALICALFAATGALRFERRSSLWTTALAMLLLLFLIGWRGRVHEVVGSTIALSGIGLLTMWLADLVRRSMEGAASRAFLQRFLPAELVENAFDDPLTAFGEPRAVDATVLVSDLRGFTALSERIAPDQVFAFLSRLHGELARIIHAHGGVVDKFLGDGMLAVFGATGDVRDHAARAVAAARDMRAAVLRLNESNVLGAPIRIGIGIHSGPLVAGCLGSGDRLEWTVIGDTVNTAARIEALTKDHAVDILFTGAVVERGGELRARALGPTSVRGRGQQLALYTTVEPSLLPPS